MAASSTVRCIIQYNKSSARSICISWRRYSFLVSVRGFGIMLRGAVCVHPAYVIRLIYKIYISRHVILYKGGQSPYITHPRFLRRLSTETICKHFAPIRKQRDPRAFLLSALAKPLYCLLKFCRCIYYYKCIISHLCHFVYKYAFIPRPIFIIPSTFLIHKYTTGW